MKLDCGRKEKLLVMVRLLVRLLLMMLLLVRGIRSARVLRHMNRRWMVIMWEAPTHLNRTLDRELRSHVSRYNPMFGL